MVPGFPEVEEFIQKAKKLFYVTKVVLFGSRIQGEKLQTSDIDIIIVSPDFKNTMFFDRPSKLIHLWNGSYHLDLICYTPEEFADKSEQIGMVSEAIKRGVVIDQP